MKHMFKKSLVAAAVLGFSSSAMAATLTFDTEYVAEEYVSTIDEANDVHSVSIAVALATNYADNDTIIVQFEGAYPNADSVTGDDISGAGDGSISLVSYDAETGRAVFRATGVTGNTSGGTFNISAEFDMANVDSDVGVTYQAYLGTDTTSSNAQVLGTKGEADIFASHKQFANLTVDDDGLDKTVDVQPVDIGDEVYRSRVRFEDWETAGDQVVTATFAFNNDNLPDGESFDHSVTAATVDYTLTGSFGWMLDEEDELIAGLATFCDDNATEVEVASGSITFTCAQGDTQDISFDLGNNTQSVPAQEFTLAATVNYTNADNGDEEGTQPLSAVGAGEWDLNGASAFIPYMPYASVLNQILLVTNSGDENADISVRWWDENGNSEEFNLSDYDATAQENNYAAPGITRITGTLKAALAAETGADLSGSTRRFALELFINAPTENIEVYSAYMHNEDGDRNIVINSTNR